MNLFPGVGDVNDILRSKEYLIDSFLKMIANNEISEQEYNLFLLKIIRNDSTQFKFQIMIYSLKDSIIEIIE